MLFTSMKLASKYLLYLVNGGEELTETEWDTVEEEVECVCVCVWPV